MDKIVKRIYEIYEVDKFGNMNLMEIMEDNKEAREYIINNPNLGNAKWGITETGEIKIITCDGYFYSKRF